MIVMVECVEKCKRQNQESQKARTRRGWKNQYSAESAKYKLWQAIGFMGRPRQRADYIEFFFIELKTFNTDTPIIMRLNPQNHHVIVYVRKFSNQYYYTRLLFRYHNVSNTVIHSNRKTSGRLSNITPQNREDGFLLSRSAGD